MDKDKYIKKLVEVGLLPREARIYLALLSKNSFTATEIAKVSGIPRQKIYEILDNIIKKGICVEKVGKVKRYKAVEPESVFSGLIEKYKEKEKLALKLSDDLSALYEKNRERIDPLEYIEVLKDKGQIHKKWISFERKAKKEILGFSKAPYTRPLANNLSEEIKILEKKVNIRGIYEYKGITSESEKEEFIKIISRYISAGEKARVIQKLPMKLAIFDEKITMFALEDPISLKQSITTMIINHPVFAKALKNVFESTWQKAMTLEEFKIKGV